MMHRNRSMKNTDGKYVYLYVDTKDTHGFYEIFFITRILQLIPKLLVRIKPKYTRVNGFQFYILMPHVILIDKEVMLLSIIKRGV